MKAVSVFLEELQKRIDSTALQTIDFENKKNKAEKIEDLKVFSNKLKTMSHGGKVIINGLSLKQKIIFWCYKFDLFNFMYFLYKIKK